MKKKKIIYLILLCIGIVLGFISTSIIYKSHYIVTNERSIYSSNNNLAIMLESSLNSEEYYESTTGDWPDNEDYVFNSTVSRCKNGSTLRYDEDEKKVYVSGNKSDFCYIYFDVYDIPVINTVNYTTTYSSISLDVSTTAGDGEITTYYYSIDGGTNWISSDQSTHQFTSLAEKTTYKVPVKVKDSNNRTSDIYELDVITDTYIVPLINNVSQYLTKDSITVSVNAYDGDGTITTYYYSLDDSTYESSSSNTYNFSDIDVTASHSIEIYVEDDNGRVSSVYTFNSDIGLILANYIVYTSDGTDSLYYFDSTGDYTNASLEAEDYSYRYSGGDYVLTTLASNAGHSTITNKSTSETTGFINFYCNDELSYVGATCSASYTYYYTLAYDTNATQYSTYQEVLNQAVTDGYLTENNIKNYVCFGSDDETCPDDNLYRIIGFFKNDSDEYEMKLIKADYATSDLLGTDGDWYSSANTSYLYSGNRSTTTASSQARYYWSKANYSTSYSNSGYYNDWYYSQLNTVNLNTNYYATLESSWQNMISSHTWIVGGNTYLNLFSSNASTAYTNEIVNYVTDQYADGYEGKVVSTYTANVGLMYLSDYYFAASSTYWTYPGLTNSSYPNSNGDYGANYDYRIAYNSNWMYAGTSEWTISRASSATTIAFFVAQTGYIGGYTVNKNILAIRPVVYLKSSTQIISGQGTESNPYHLSVN